MLSWNPAPGANFEREEGPLFLGLKLENSKLMEMKKEFVSMSHAHQFKKIFTMGLL